MAEGSQFLTTNRKGTDAWVLDAVGHADCGLVDGGLYERRGLAQKVKRGHLRTTDVEASYL